MASWNGFTSHDEVGYYAFAAKSELRELLAFAIDVMSAPLAGVSDEVYEHERRVVEAERGFVRITPPGRCRTGSTNRCSHPGTPTRAR